MENHILNIISHFTRFLIKYLFLIGFLVFFFLNTNVLAHTNSVCYVNSGPGSVTFWYGSWHSSVSFKEGELKLTGTGATSYGPSIVQFTELVHTTPTGCISGTNYFNTDGTDLIAYGSNSSINWQSYSWQGVTFTGLAVGSYEFDYIEKGHAESSFTGSPSADWQPVPGIKIAAVTLDSAAVGNTVSLSSTVPVDNSTEVNLTVKTVELVFDQVVNIGSGVIKLIKTASDTLVESLNITSSSISGGGTNTIIATWTSALEHSTDYCIQIDSGALEATDGTDYTGISDKTTFNFSTMGLPYLTATVPSDNATNLSIATSTLELTFNEAVSANSGNITLVNTSTAQTVETFSVSGSKITGWGSTKLSISITDTLSVATNYHILIDNTAIKNSGSAAYGGISDQTTLNFSTSSDGIVTLVSSSPTDNAEEVAIDNRTLVLNFSDSVIKGSGNIRLYSATDEIQIYSVDVLSAEVVGAGSSTISITWPDWLKPNTAYYVNIDTTVFTNSIGQIYAGINNQTSLNFKTTATPSSPWDDPEITAVVEAQTELVDRRLYESIRPILDRLDWFRKNRYSRNQSIQGINIEIIHPAIDPILDSPAMDALASIESEFFTELTDAVSIEAPELEDNWAIWSAGDITIGKIGQKARSSFKHFQSDGLTIGLDKKLNNSELLGATIRAGSDKTDIGVQGTHVDTVDFGMALYRTWAISDNYFVDFILGANQFNIKTHREIGFGNPITGERRAYQGYQSIALQREITFKDLFVTPYSRLDVGYTNMRPFDESGGNAAISFKEQHVRHAKSNLGLQFDYLFNTSFGKIRPYSRIEYALDLSSSSVVSASYVSTPDTLYHSKIHDFRGSNWKYGLGIDFTFLTGWLAASYERIEESEDRNDHQVSRKSDNMRIKFLFNF